MIKLSRFASIFALLLGLATSLITAGPAMAAGPALNMLEDSIFDNTGTMGAAQIQSYLATQNTTDFTNDQTCLAAYQTPNFYWDGTYWHYGDLSSGNNAWNASFGPNQVSAATAISQAAQFWGINPQVILATLQKEEALPHGTSCATWRFNSAMGQDCPNATLHDYPDINVYQTCVAHENYAGFTRQMLWGSFQLRFARLRSEGDGNLSWQDNGSIQYVGKETAGTRARYQGGPLTTYDGQVTLCDTGGNNCQVWTLANGATASLVSYTPFYPQMFNYWFNEIVSFTGGTARCTNPSLTNVYRFWSQRFNNAHFFTASTSERDALFADGNWKYEGVAFCESSAVATGYSPVYRFWSPTYGNVHFFTASEADKSAVMSDSHWKYEGVAFYAPTDPATDAAAVGIARFWSPRFNNDHFFTGVSGEISGLKNDPNWRFETGSAWYGELPQ